MYSNIILNSQESTTILMACTKKSGNLSYAPRTYTYVSVFVCMLISDSVFEIIDSLLSTRHTCNGES